VHFQVLKQVLEKAEETGQIANIRWIMKKQKSSRKNIYFCFIDYVKAFDCVDHNKLWEILKEMGIPEWDCLVSKSLSFTSSSTFTYKER